MAKKKTSQVPSRTTFSTVTKKRKPIDPSQQPNGLYRFFDPIKHGQDQLQSARQPLQEITANAGSKRSRNEFEMGDRNGISQIDRPKLEAGLEDLMATSDHPALPCDSTPSSLDRDRASDVILRPFEPMTPALARDGCPPQTSTGREQVVASAISTVEESTQATSTDVSTVGALAYADILTLAQAAPSFTAMSSATRFTTAALTQLPISANETKPSHYHELTTNSSSTGDIHAASTCAPRDFLPLRAIICISRTSGRRIETTLQQLAANNDKLYSYFQQHLHSGFHKCSPGQCKAEYMSLIFNGYSSNSSIKNSKQLRDGPAGQMKHFLELIASEPTRSSVILMVSLLDGFFTNNLALRDYFAPYASVDFHLLIYRKNTEIDHYELSDVLSTISQMQAGQDVDSPCADLVKLWSEVALNKESVAAHLRANRMILPDRRRNNVVTIEEDTANITVKYGSSAGPPARQKSSRMMFHACTDDIRCNFIADSLKQLNAHIDTTHCSSDGRVMCECGISFSNASSRRKHQNDNHCKVRRIIERDLFKCTDCEMEFGTREGLRDHINKAHKRRGQVVEFAVSAGLIDADAGFLSGVRGALKKI